MQLAGAWLSWCRLPLPIATVVEPHRALGSVECGSVCGCTAGMMDPPLVVIFGICTAFDHRKVTLASPRCSVHHVVRVTTRCHAQPFVIWEADGSLTGYMADVLSSLAAETGISFNYSRNADFAFNTDMTTQNLNWGPYAFEPGINMMVGTPSTLVSTYLHWAHAPELAP